jgi:predicted MPP superfamily phosphohydrolase
MRRGADSGTGGRAHAVSARRATVATVAVVAWCLLLGAWAALVEPDWIEVTRHSVGTPSPGHRPFRIVQLADLHLRRIGVREERTAAAVREARPDLLVLCGDLLDRPDALPLLDRFLSLAGDAPATVAVLGNWEHWAGIDPAVLRAVLARHRGRLLVDEGMRLEHEGLHLAVTGLDDATTGHVEPARAAATAGGLRNVLALSHAPVARDAWEGPAPSFLLAAHTHGGQVAFLGRAPSLPPGSGGYVAGWYRGPPFDAYVSRGIGTSVLPIRFGARPEVAIFDWWLDASPREPEASAGK